MSTIIDRDAALVVVNEHILSTVEVLVDTGDIDDVVQIRDLGRLRCTLLNRALDVDAAGIRLLGESVDWVADRVEDDLDADTDPVGAEQRRFYQVRDAVATLRGEMAGGDA